MESYIVRIYRRCQSEPSQIAGLVEIVGSEERTTFNSISGLISAVKQVIAGDDSDQEKAGPCGRNQGKKVVLDD